VATSFVYILYIYRTHFWPLLKINKQIQREIKPANWPPTINSEWSENFFQSILLLCENDPQGFHVYSESEDDCYLKAEFSGWSLVCWATPVLSFSDKTVQLYSAELWSLTVKHMKTLEAAHHKFQQQLLGIKLYDRGSNWAMLKSEKGMAKL